MRGANNTLVVSSILGQKKAADFRGPASGLGQTNSMTLPMIDGGEVVHLKL